jgi:hypothetical protein
MILEGSLEGRRIVVVTDFLELRQAMQAFPVDDSGIEHGRLSHFRYLLGHRMAAAAH